MGLESFVVPRDKFELDEPKGGLSFPCCVCKHRNGTDRDEPCRHCDHNLGAVADDE